MVSNASDDFPDPESPVITTILSRGIWMSMFFRLCSRAPLTWMEVSGIATSARWCGASRTATAAHDAPARARRARHIAVLAHADDRLGSVLKDDKTAQLDDLVTEERRLLELEVPCGLLHLSLEVLDETHELVLRELARGDRAAALLVHLLDVGDPLQPHTDVAD